jgi:putative phosphoribosyl transferase
LVDDGAATGSTIIIASRWIVTKKPRYFILAIPIAPKNTVNLFKYENIDYIEVITTPSSNFKTVEQYYKNFNQVTDKEVIDILAKHKTTT